MKPDSVVFVMFSVDQNSKFKSSGGDAAGYFSTAIAAKYYYYLQNTVSLIYSYTY